MLIGVGHTDTPVLDQELEDDTHSLLLQLEPRERTVVLEHMIDGRQWNEIAKHLGMTEGAVKKVFYRVQPRLRKQLNALRERYKLREEPLPENRPPPMYVYTLSDLERTIAGLPAKDQAEILELARTTLPRRRNYHD